MTSIRVNINLLATFLLFAFSAFSRADELPNQVQLLDVPSENLYLKVIAFNDYAQNTHWKTELLRNNLFQVEEAVTADASGENVSKSVYSYDNSGYQTKMTTYAYKNGGWAPQEEDEYLFDDEGRQVMAAKYEYAGNIRSGVGEKWVKTFDSNGICTDYETFTWKNNGWVSFMRKETSVHAKGMISSIKTWDSSGKMSSNVIFMYNAISGLLERETYQTHVNGSFVNSFSILYTHDSSRRITRVEMQSFEENTWKTFEKRIFSYADDGKNITATRHVFSDSGEKIAETNFVSSGDNAVVTSDGASLRHSNSDGYTISQQTVGNRWEDVERYHYTDNDDFANALEIYSDNKKTYQLRWDIPEETPDELVFTQEYIGDSGNADVEKRIVFSFSGDITKTKNTPATKTFTLYPNPVADMLTVELADALTDNTDYFIYNTSGRLVMRGKIDVSTQKINLTGLLPGQYIFSVHLNGKLYSMVLLKK